jgi:ribosome-associated protein
MNGPSLPPLELVKLCCHALDEKKAVDLRVLDVSEQSSITDYLVLATGTSEPHLRALRVELEKVLDSTHTRIVGMETVQESGWIVVDAFDVMIHVFAPDVREKYGLENLWKDAVEVSVPQLLAPGKPAAAVRKAPAKRGAAARTPNRSKTRKPAARAVKKRSKA